MAELSGHAKWCRSLSHSQFLLLGLMVSTAARVSPVHQWRWPGCGTQVSGWVSSTHLTSWSGAATAIMSQEDISVGISPTGGGVCTAWLFMPEPSVLWLCLCPKVLEPSTWSWKWCATHLPTSHPSTCLHLTSRPMGNTVQWCTQYEKEKWIYRQALETSAKAEPSKLI